MTPTAPSTSAATLRAMRWWDVDDVVAIERAVFVFDPWTPAGFWSELAGVPATRTYIVAEDAGEIVGYGGLAVVGADADVQTLAVRHDAQGRGIGRTLLLAVVDEARRRGATQLLLEARATNAPALALYESEGFEQIAVRRGYYGAAGDAVVMRRRLTA